MGTATVFRLISRVCLLIDSVGDHLQSVVLFLFRLNWGWQFFETGLGKLKSHENVVQFFTSLGIPFPEFNSYFVGGVECVGGVLLLIGLISRPIALILSINMFVAYISVEEDRQRLFGIIQDPGPFIAADPFFFLLTALLVLAFGPGIISLDWCLQKKRLEKGRSRFASN